MAHNTSEQNTHKQRIVIIGGGFAGLNLFKKLDTGKFEIVVVDRNNFHSFPPLFYQVASSVLDPGSISFPLRREMRRKRMQGARYHLGTVKSIDTANKLLTTQFETIAYDKLVIAAGTTNNFFNIPDIEKKVFTIKSAPEALRCRNEILDRLERASLLTDATARRKLLSFTIVGGGAAGVEIAGALGEMKRYILKREYPNIQQDDVSVTIVEGADALLRSMSPKSQAAALEYMGHLMVDVKLGKTLKTYNDNEITFTDGTTQYSEMLIWTAGVTPIPFEFKGIKPQLGPGRRYVVDEYNRIVGMQDVFAIGDICVHTDQTWPYGLPQVAQVAIQQGKTLAHNLNKGNMAKPFKYRDKGSMATVGRNRAVVDMKHLHMYGRPAWFTWMFIHLISLLGMRNKITVLITWIWSYFTYSSSLRLLLHPTRYPQRHIWTEK